MPTDLLAGNTPPKKPVDLLANNPRDPIAEKKSSGPLDYFTNKTTEDVLGTGTQMLAQGIKDIVHPEPKKVPSFEGALSMARIGTPMPDKPDKELPRAMTPFIGAAEVAGAPGIAAMASVANPVERNTGIPAGLTMLAMGGAGALARKGLGGISEIKESSPKTPPPASPPAPSRAPVDLLATMPEQAARQERISKVTSEGVPVVARAPSAKEGLKQAAKDIRNFIAPENASQEAHTMGGIIRKEYGSAEHDIARADENLAKIEPVARELAKNERHMLNAVDYMEGHSKGYKAPTPEIKTMADALRAAHKENEDLMKETDGLEGVNIVKDYFRRKWTEPEKADAVFDSWVDKSTSGKKGSTASWKARTFPSTLDGYEAGLKLKNPNIFESQMEGIAGTRRAIAYNRMINEARNLGYAKYFPSPKKVPQGWVPLEGRLSEKLAAPEEGKIIRQQLYVHPDAAKLLNNFYGKGFTNKGFMALQGASNAMKASALALSGVHAGTVMLHSVINGAKNALGDIARGKPIKGVSGLAKAAINPLTGARTGGAIQRASLAKAGEELEPKVLKALSRVSPEAVKSVRLLQESGGLQHRIPLDFKASTGRNYLDQFIRANFKAGENFKGMKDFMKDIPGAVRPTKGAINMSTFAKGVGKALDSTAAPLMDYYIPKMKMTQKVQDLSSWLEKHPGATAAEEKAQALRISNHVDNILGEMNRDMLFWPKAFNQSVQLAMLSYSFVYGIMREAALASKSAVKGTGKALGGDIKGSLKELSQPELQFIATAAITYGMLGAVRNYLATGKAPESTNDLFAPQTGGTDIYGQPEREVMPGHVSQVYHYFHDFNEEIMNELNPALQTAYRAFKNKDYNQKAIVNPNLSYKEEPLEKLQAWGKYLMKQMAPMSFSPQQEQTPGSNITKPERFMGAKPLAGWISNPEIQKNMNRSEEMKRYKSDVVRANRTGQPMPDIKNYGVE